MDCANGAGAAFSENGREAYVLKGNGGTLGWLAQGLGGAIQEITPPAKLPRLSWACGLAWDTKRGVLAVTTTGGEGYFYRYDTRRHTWLDARSLKGRDLLSLAFDAVSDRYVGVSDRAELLFFSADGAVERVRPMFERLPGLRERPGQGAYQMYGLVLAAYRGAVAITRVRNGSVTHIWTYDSGADRAQLTYKN